MTAPSKKRLHQSKKKTQAVQKANRETNLLCSLSSHLCTGQMTSLLQNHPKVRGKSLLVSDQSPFLSPTVHTYNS